MKKLQFIANINAPTADKVYDLMLGNQQQINV